MRLNVGMVLLGKIFYFLITGFYSVTGSVWNTCKKRTTTSSS